MTISVLPAYPSYRDLTGAPLDNGYIYIGTAGADAQTNPLTAYWDKALTIPVVQPIRTINGYPSYVGSPGTMYVNATDFSITVRDKAGVLVYSAQNTTQIVATATLQLLGDVTGSVAIAAGSTAQLSATVVDGSHNHIISNVTGLQTTLDDKASLTGTPTTFTGTVVAPAVNSTKSAPYTLAGGDMNTTITTTADVTVNTGIGSAGDVVIVANNSGSSINITAGTITGDMRLAGTGTAPGSRAIAQYGVAFIFYIDADNVLVGGAGVT